MFDGKRARDFHSIGVDIRGALPMSRAISPDGGVSTGAVLAWRSRPISSAKLLSPSASITQGRSKFLSNQRKLLLGRRQ